jgi:DNA-binding MltR family transcriptional regulator
LEPLFQELDESSDRSAAIVGAATIDRLLEDAILASFPQIDEETTATLTGIGGPLDSLFAKIHLGYALGLYPRSYLLELESIRKIRNCFAHSPTNITFDTEQIADECRQLKEMEYINDQRGNRQRYISACRIMMVFILTQELISKSERHIRKHRPTFRGYSEAVESLSHLKDLMRQFVESEDIIARNTRRAPSSNDS